MPERASACGEAPRCRSILGSHLDHTAELCVMLRAECLLRPQLLASLLFLISSIPSSMSAVPDMPDRSMGGAGHLPQEGMELGRHRTVMELAVSKEECVPFA